jgi:hypothetical protein
MLGDTPVPSMKTMLALLGLCAVLSGPLLKADEISPDVQAKIDHWIAEAKQWAADPEIVKAVVAQNAQLPAGFAEMTQEKWESLTDNDPFVRALTRNAAAQLLRAKRTDEITEAFLSDGNGLKVAFLTKTTNWSHKGKPKHEVPMAGKPWQGKLELDKSSGARQVQVSVPVLEGEKPVGSLVIGVSLSALASE